MNDKDKDKLIEILNEIEKLKKYNNDLASNTKGKKLEGYIDSLNKDINSLKIKVEKIYEDNFEKVETLE